MELNDSLEVVSGSKKQVAEGVASIVYRAQRKLEDGTTWVAIKSSSVRRRYCPEPHDIIKEAAVLADISHHNIIECVGSAKDISSGTFEVWTTWVPYNLEDLLDDPAFTPSPYPTSILHLVIPEVEDKSPSRASVFGILSKSIIYQVADAIKFLHTRQPSPIAHRDIKPRNILITSSGCVKLIDFGIAYSDEFCGSPGNVWPEPPDEMYCDVATGPYRAPELIFGPRHYDAIASDLWSFGATVAQFYTQIQLRRGSYGYDDEDEDDDDDDDNALHSDSQQEPYKLPTDVDSITFRSAEWTRVPLFDSSRGSIGLAWSIFKLRGTPNAESWPDFEELPDATKIQFMETPCVELKPHLPNLPVGVQATGVTHAIPPDIPTHGTPLDLIHRLLVYPPKDRLKAADVLTHPWFKEGDPLLIPPEISAELEGSDTSAAHEWNKESLEHWLEMILGTRGVVV